MPAETVWQKSRRAFPSRLRKRSQPSNIGKTPKMLHRSLLLFVLISAFLLAIRCSAQQIDAVDTYACSVDNNRNINDDPSSQLKALARYIKSGQANRILVVAGAGISVSAGIPDFRSPTTGLYDNLQRYNLPSPEAVFDVEFFRKDPQPFVSLAGKLWPKLSRPLPTMTHHFLKLLQNKGLLLRVYTQNIDGLEHAVGIREDKLVECHGHFRSASCINCGKAVDDPKEVIDTMVTKGEIPICKHCGSHVKPDIVFFGEPMPGHFEDVLLEDLEQVDLLFILGTSLQVAPVSLIPKLVDKDCKRVLMNRELVLENMRPHDIFIPGDCDENILHLSSLLGWEDELMKLATFHVSR